MIALVYPKLPIDELAVQVVERAIEANGGLQSVRSYRAITWQEQGTYYGQDRIMPFQGEHSVQFPNCYRMSVKGAFTIVIRDRQGWISMGGKVEPLPPCQLHEYQEANYAMWVMQLHPLLASDRFGLEILDSREHDVLSDCNGCLEELGLHPFASPMASNEDDPFDQFDWSNDEPQGYGTVDSNEQLIGVRVSHPRRRDLDLYFDPHTFLLRKSVRMGHSPEFGPNEIVMETVYEDHTPVDGVFFPTKMTMYFDGQRVIDTHTGSYRLHHDLSDSTFTCPV